MISRRSLLLDDDAITSVFVGEVLRAQGHQVDLACSIAAARQLMRCNRYDFILADRRLPDGDGLLWLSELATDEPAAQRLLLTGDALPAAQVPTGVRYLQKPIDVEQLIGWLESRATEQIDLNPRSTSGPGLLNDHAALRRLGGRMESLRALRAMLREELLAGRAWHMALVESARSSNCLAQLHRLRASCALTGCTQLEQQAALVESILRNGRQPNESEQACFVHCVNSTLSALEV